MSLKRSIAGVLVELEAQVARLEREESFHAEQEAAHRRKREACAERLALIRERYEAFRSASAAVGEVVAESAPALEDSEGRASVIRLIVRIVAAKGPDECFTPSELAGELIRQFPKSFRRPVGNRTISSTLRRLADQGRIRVVEEGKPYHEAVYSRSVR